MCVPRSVLLAAAALLVAAPACDRGAADAGGPPGLACERAACAARCGEVPDGCGGTIVCGECPAIRWQVLSEESYANGIDGWKVSHGGADEAGNRWLLWERGGVYLRAPSTYRLERRDPAGALLWRAEWDVFGTVHMAVTRLGEVFLAVGPRCELRHVYPSEPYGGTGGGTFESCDPLDAALAGLRLTEATLVKLAPDGRPAWSRPLGEGTKPSAPAADEQGSVIVVVARGFCDGCSVPWGEAEESVAKFLSDGAPAWSVPSPPGSRTVRATLDREGNAIILATSGYDAGLDGFPRSATTLAAGSGATMRARTWAADARPRVYPQWWGADREGLTYALADPAGWTAPDGSTPASGTYALVAFGADGAPLWARLFDGRTSSSLGFGVSRNGGATVTWVPSGEEPRAVETYGAAGELLWRRTLPGPGFWLLEPLSFDGGELLLGGTYALGGWFGAALVVGR